MRGPHGKAVWELIFEDKGDMDTQNEEHSR